MLVGHALPASQLLLHDLLQPLALSGGIFKLGRSVRALSQQPGSAGAGRQSSPGARNPVIGEIRSESFAALKHTEDSRGDGGLPDDCGSVVVVGGVRELGKSFELTAEFSERGLKPGEGMAASLLPPWAAARCPGSRPNRLEKLLTVYTFLSRRSPEPIAWL